MEDFLRSWGYLGIFGGILASGLGFPIPEELPVVVGGVLAGRDTVYWWLMLPVCIIGVIIGDTFLYLIGRFWGRKLFHHGWLKRRFLPDERVQAIEENFQIYGVKILLFARLTPGIRAPIFVIAGMTRLPWTKFVFADGIYAVPGVSILFFLGYWFSERMVSLIEEAETIKPIIALVALTGVAAYLLYRVWRKPMVTGNPHEMPPLVERMTDALESVTTRIMQSGEGASLPPSPPGTADAKTEVERPPHEARKTE